MSQPTTGGTPGQFGYNDLGQIVAGNNNTNYILSLMLGALQQMIGSSGGGAGGGITVNYPSVTGHSSIVSGAGTIPPNSKGWTFTVLTGPIASFNGAASLPAGFSDSDPNPNAAAISYDATGGTAYVRYNS